MILESKSALDQLIQEGARKMLQAALDKEVAEFLERTKDQRTEAGLREVVRNGYHPKRDILSGAGPLGIQQHNDDFMGRIREARQGVEAFLGMIPGVERGYTMLIGSLSIVSSIPRQRRSGFETTIS